MTNDFELNILVNNGTSEISVKWVKKVTHANKNLSFFKSDKI